MSSTELDQLGLYRSGLGAAARRAGEERSSAADADGMDEARRLILELTEAGFTVTADDIRPRMRVGSPAVLGAAFAALCREGVIEVAGYSVSSSPSRHGGLVRQWRGVQP